VFDMDETLIHTHDFKVKDYEIKVPFKTIHNKVISGYVSVRPYAKEIIKNMSRFYDVVIFTAANQCYADPILDYIDP
jgi:CTD small phosphatase-like protein 2